MQSFGPIILFSACLLPVLFIGLLLMAGRGAGLIAGFNTMKPDERARYDEPRLCRFVGKVVLSGWALMMLVPLGIALDTMWIAAVAGGIFLAVIIASVVYMNTGNRFKKL